MNTLECSESCSRSHGIYTAYCDVGSFYGSELRYKVNELSSSCPGMVGSQKHTPHKYAKTSLAKLWKSVSTLDFVTVYLVIVILNVTLYLFFFFYFCPLLRRIRLPYKTSGWIWQSMEKVAFWPQMMYVHHLQAGVYQPNLDPLTLKTVATVLKYYLQQC